MDCLICLPDKSGNFLAFRAKTAQNTVKPEKTGFGMAIIARLRPVFCVFGVKKLRTFYFNLTEQCSRKKLAVGGFEPERGSTPVPCSTKETSFVQRLGFVAALSFVIARLNRGKPFLPRDDPFNLAEKFFFLRPHLRRFVAECGNRHLFIHKFIISHLAVYGTFFCAVLP